MIADTNIPDTTAELAIFIGDLLSRTPAPDRTDEAISYAVRRKFGDGVSADQLREASRLGEYHRLAHAQWKAVCAMRLNGWRGTID